MVKYITAKILTFLASLFAGDHDSRFESEYAGEEEADKEPIDVIVLESPILELRNLLLLYLCHVFELEKQRVKWLKGPKERERKKERKEGRVDKQRLLGKGCGNVECFAVSMIEEATNIFSFNLNPFKSKKEYSIIIDVFPIYSLFSLFKIDRPSSTPTKFQPTISPPPPPPLDSQTLEGQLDLLSSAPLASIAPRYLLRRLAKKRRCLPQHYLQEPRKLIHESQQEVRH
ncbi:hypothetical protein LguiA_033698 [Lonicera macranthoides]